MLAPLGGVFCVLVRGRRAAYGRGLLPSARLPVPVVVVGNVTVGGTGKTPLVLWLVDHLRRGGLLPGVVTRGYGGRSRAWPQRVSADSDPDLVGDEAVLLARRGGCPVAAGPERLAAGRLLVEDAGCDVLVCDDGLQHYRLWRDVEVAVVDGNRRFGNGRCLPAGPLREPPGRLASVDFVVARGPARAGEFPMTYAAEPLRRVVDEAEAGAPPPGETVHAVAGIGDPAPFFAGLREAGYGVIEHAFPDHYRYRLQDLDFGDGRPLIMTEKDAVKCRRFARPDMWYRPVSARVPAGLAASIRAQLEELRG